MANMKIWYDEQGDYLEFSMEKKKGFFKDVGNDIWERVDVKGHILGFAILNFKKRIAKRNKEIRLPVEVAFR